MHKLLLLFSCMLVMISSCRYRNDRRIHGDGSVSTETRNVTGFTGVETHGDIDIVVEQGPFNVKVEADQNILQYIETKVEHGRLVVDFKPGLSLQDINTARVYVTAPELNAFETHGSGDISGKGKLTNKDSMDIKVDGSGDIELRIDCPIVKTETHGSGDMSIAGESRSVQYETDGSGDVKASDLKAEMVKVSIHGSGDIEVYASDALDVEISGSGDVHYRGSPKTTSSIHGSGELSKMD